MYWVSPASRQVTRPSSRKSSPNSRNSDVKISWLLPVVLSLRRTMTSSTKPVSPPSSAPVPPSLTPPRSSCSYSCKSDRVEHTIPKAGCKCAPLFMLSTFDFQLNAIQSTDIVSVVAAVRLRCAGGRRRPRRYRDARNDDCD